VCFLKLLFLHNITFDMLIHINLKPKIMTIFKKITVVLLLLFVGTAFSQSIMTDVVGERASDGERMIESKGYYHISTHKTSTEAISYWWSNGRKECVQVNVYDGHIAKIKKTNHYDCNKSGSDSNSSYYSRNHKSYQYGNQNYGSSKETSNAFERGYNDGLYNKSFHNIWKQESTPNHHNAYIDGYQKGVDERGGRTSYHSGRGGNASHEAVFDLIGKDAVWSYSEIVKRGFNQQKEFQNNGITYRVWYNKNTRQCVKTYSKDYKIYDIKKSTHCF